MKIFSADITGSTAAAVQAYDTNPTTPAIADGSVWINRSNLAINFSFNSSSVASGVWTNGQAMSPGRLQGGGIGSQNAFLYAGGGDDHESICNETYEYDGEAWAEGGAITTAIAGVGATGTQNAGLINGGITGQNRPGPSAHTSRTCTEEYDGSSWATQEAMNTGRGQLTSQGTQNAAVTLGGASCAGTYTYNDYSCVEEYDGTDWTVGNVFNAYNNTPTNSNCGAVGIASSGGSQNATLIMGGGEPVYASYGVRQHIAGENLRCNFVEEYDGTSWTTQTAFSEKRIAAAAFGTVNDTGMVGGTTDWDTTHVATTCLWDGTAWSTSNTANNGRIDAKSTTDASMNAAVIAGGFQFEGTPSEYDYSNYRCCTEHWDRNLSNSLVTKELVAKDGIISASSNTNGSVSQSLASTASFGSGQFTSVHANSHLRVSKVVVNDNKVSASLASTASFGRVRAQGTISASKFVGDGSNITNVSATATPGTVSGSAQLSKGFGNISGSLASTGSFGNVQATSVGTPSTKFYGDGAGLDNVSTPSNLLVTGSFKLQSTEPMQIPLLTSDPAINTLGPGSVWINRTLGTINFSYLSSSVTDRTWSAGGTIGDGKVFRTAVGTQNAQILFNGYCPPPAPSTNPSCISEEVKTYDGTSWTISPTSTNSEHAARGGAGTQNAATAFGGVQYEGPSNAVDGNTTNSEEFDGSSWTEGNNTTVCRTAWASVGTQNSIIAFNGILVKSCRVFDIWTEYNINSYNEPHNETIGYDGTTWVACNDTVQSQGWRAGFGTVGAAVAAGGTSTGTTGNENVEEWDGTSWATGEDVTTSRSHMGGAGTQNDGVIFGGITNPGYSNSYCNQTETYDGTNWSNGPTLGTARLTYAGGGSSTAAFYVGSWEWDCYASHACCTEEYTEGSLDTTLVRRMSGSAYTY